MSRFRGVTLALLLLFAAGSVLAAGDRPAKKAEFKPTEEEQAIVDATNAERAKEKLPPLKPNEKLFIAARKHSETMAKREKMEHIFDGKDPIHRARAAGYREHYLYENIAWNQRNPAELLKEWMASEQHRKNILEGNVTEIGIGVARSAKGEPYFTQLFASPRPR